MKRWRIYTPFVCRIVIERKRSRGMHAFDGKTAGRMTATVAGPELKQLVDPGHCPGQMDCDKWLRWVGGNQERIDLSDMEPRTIGFHLLDSDKY